MEEIQQYINSICEVLNLENHVHFIGRIRAYDRAKDEITVQLRRGLSTPQGVLYHAPVKLHIEKNGEEIILLYGVLERCAADHWRIRLQRACAMAERRGSFRQPLRHISAVVQPLEETDVQEGGQDAPKEELCPIVNISLSGLCFESRQTYAVGSRLLISGLRVRPEGALYHFTCTVKRSTPQKKNAFHYGCAFDTLSARRQDALFQDLFALQVRGYNRK